MRRLLLITLPTLLARRMGVEELIWDCEYWAAGIGMTKAGAAGKTSFWRRHTG